MGFLTNIYTSLDRDLMLYEIELFKRQDYSEIRSSSLEFLRNNEDINLLKKTLKSLDLINVTLAIEPTQSIIEIISNFFKKSLNREILLDLSYDPNLIGGAVFIYNGKYLDLSISNQLI